eukprot:COSAG01_NODE_578_length_15259_cov_10.160950_9_plen_200_part_00
MGPPPHTPRPTVSCAAAVVGSARQRLRDAAAAAAAVAWACSPTRPASPCCGCACWAWSSRVGWCATPPSRGSGACAIYDLAPRKNTPNRQKGRCRGGGRGAEIDARAGGVCAGRVRWACAQPHRQDATLVAAQDHHRGRGRRARPGARHRRRARRHRARAGLLRRLGARGAPALARQRRCAHAAASWWPSRSAAAQRRP